MTERAPDDPTAAADLGAALSAMLADPDLWHDTDPSLADRVVDEVEALAGSPPAHRRRRFVVSVAAAAATVLVVVGVATLVADDAPSIDDGVEVALTGTGDASEATATAVVSETPPGTRIDLEVAGLEPAPPGSYYEAWMWNEQGVGVSAGTFHVRGGDAVIELWSGVALDDFPRLTVTLQQEGQIESSDDLVLVPATSD